MGVALFLSWASGGVVPDLAGIAGITRATSFRPAPRLDGLAQDEGSPSLALQIEFADVAALEAASDPLRELTRDATDQQAFQLHRYLDDAPQAPHCSYLVHYPGPAADTAAWLVHYAAHHIPLMCRLPGIRGVEMLTPLNWTSTLPVKRAGHMQRNRVTFDSTEGLLAALNSPIRDQMRADTADYPPYQGGMFHFAMVTEILDPAHRPLRESKHDPRDHPLRRRNDLDRGA